MVIGIDISLRNTGCTAIEGNDVIDAVTIATGKGNAKRVADDNVRRCTELAIGLRDFINKHNPSHAFMEVPTGGSQDARAARAMAMSTGVVVTVLALMGVPSTCVTPTDVKKACGGNKDSDKNFVKEAVKKVFNWKCKRFNEHLADSAGAVLAGLKGGKSFA
jgi:Holliday junction resolvasome RuvABC endonuclease subunit